MPAAIYKLCRSDGKRNPHPIVTTPDGILTSAEQVSAPLLCDVCEDRFSRSGERYVLAQCARRDGSFKARESLLTAEPFDAGEHFRVYSPRAVPTLRIDDILYFAASVFWRAGAKEWLVGRRRISISLGPYLEQLRVFLLQRQSFPVNARLFIHVWDDPEINFMAVFPCSERIDGVWRHKFAIPGLLFILFLGKNAPSLMDRGALNSAEFPAIWLRSWATDGLFRSSGELITTAAIRSAHLRPVREQYLRRRGSS